MRRRLRFAVQVLVVLVLAWPATSFAQSAFAGVLRDASGGVLPGVTIEYSDASPNAVAVRGFDPNMTSVTMDGSSLASASGSGASGAFSNASFR